MRPAFQIVALVLPMLALVAARSGAAPGGPEPARIEETLDFAPGYARADLSVRTTYEGGAAALVRGRLPLGGAAELDRAQLEIYQRRFRRLRPIAPLAIDDLGDRLVLRAEYLLGDTWSEGDDGGPPSLWLYPDEVREALAAIEGPTVGVAASEVAVPYPLHIVRVTLVRSPAPRRFPPERTLIEGPAFRLRHEVSSSGRELRIEDEVEALAPTVAAGALEEHRGALERARRTIGFELHRPPAGLEIDPEGRDPARPPPRIGAGSRQTAPGFVYRPGIGASEWFWIIVVALVVLGRPIAWVSEKVVRVLRRRRALARAEAQLVYFDRPHVWAEVGRLRFETGDRAGAEQALRRAVEAAPDLDYRFDLARVLAATARPDEAAALLRDVIARDPDHGYGDAKRLLATILVAKGLDADARPILEEQARVRPCAETRWLLMQVLLRAGEREAARAELVRLERDFKVSPRYVRSRDRGFRRKARRLRP